MDSLNNLLMHIDDTIYRDLKSALELGRWQSGSQLSSAQKAIALQALIAYENRHIPEQERTAYIYKPEHDACEHSDAEAEQVIHIKPMSKR